MQVHLSRKKRNASVPQDVRRRSDTPRVPERHGRKALQQARTGMSVAKRSRVCLAIWPGASEMRLWERKWHDRGSGTELEIARARLLSLLAQAGWQAISRAEKRLFECATDADSKKLRKAQNIRVQRMRTDLERAVLAGSYDDVTRLPGAPHEPLATAARHES